MELDHETPKNEIRQSQTMPFTNQAQTIVNLSENKGEYINHKTVDFTQCENYFETINDKQNAQSEKKINNINPFSKDLIDFSNTKFAMI